MYNQKMGMQTVWFMPVNPIGKLDIKGSLESCCAVPDFLIEASSKTELFKISVYLHL
jgi:hypothetical protein